MYSPVSNSLIFGNDINNKMIINTKKGVLDKLHKEYDIISKLGEGSFGEAFLVRNK